MANTKSKSGKKIRKMTKEKTPKKKREIEFNSKLFLKELLIKCQQGEDEWLSQKEAFSTGALKKLQISVFEKACSEGLIQEEKKGKTLGMRLLERGTQHLFSMLLPREQKIFLERKLKLLQDQSKEITENLQTFLKQIKKDLPVLSSEDISHEMESLKGKWNSVFKSFQEELNFGDKAISLTDCLKQVKSAFEENLDQKIKKIEPIKNELESFEKNQKEHIERIQEGLKKIDQHIQSLNTSSEESSFLEDGVYSEEEIENVLKSVYQNLKRKNSHRSSFSLKELYDGTLTIISSLSVEVFHKTLQNLRFKEKVDLYQSNDSDKVEDPNLGILTGRGLIYYVSWR